MLTAVNVDRSSLRERLAPAAARLAMFALFALAAIWIVRVLLSEPGRRADLMMVTIQPQEPPPHKPEPQPPEPEPEKTPPRLQPFTERIVTRAPAAAPPPVPEPQSPQAAGPPGPAGAEGTLPGLADEGDPRAELQGGASASRDGPVSLSEGAGDGSGAEATAPPRYEIAYLHNPKPVYPLAARLRSEEGTVLVRVLVNEDGTPEQVQLKQSSGSSLLDNAAMDAIRQWKFIPARRGDKRVAEWVVVPVRFRLLG